MTAAVRARTKLKNAISGKKWSGAIFNVAQRRPEGWPLWMAGHKKTPAFLLGFLFNTLNLDRGLG
ncbi:hypothetical protein ACJMQR_12115 [Pseudomonas leptonychotis]|uniref:hypothetical protein n=1 Tax=Pseudomonas leptonychotis TaxID=2448482 RepID=UPI0038998FE3